jgi:hypothetical protein
MANFSSRKLYILESKLSNSDHHRIRALAILNAINRAILATQENIPDIEFSISISDVADPSHKKRSIWALSRRSGEVEKWVVSDFGYWSWPLGMIGEYTQFLSQVKETEKGWETKIPKIVWRGAAGTNSIRKDLLAVTKGQEWADVEEVFWKSATELKAGSVETALTMPQHCNYQFVMQTEGTAVRVIHHCERADLLKGRSYSGRGKYLQNCRSVLFAHKREWIEPHHALLESSGPNQNFVEVERDFSDLKEKVLKLIENPKEAERIANNSAEVFHNRYLTPAAQACYWRRLIKAWSTVSFEPEIWEEAVEKPGGETSKRLRGTSFESFA